MVRSMLSNSSLHVSLWMYVLKTIMYLLNRVPSKVVQKTPFELWIGRKPSLRHLHVWGCQAEIRIYNPQEKKFDATTINGYFIGYPVKSKWYIFYCSTHRTRIVETGNVRFIENGETSGSEASQNVKIKEVRVQVPLTSASTSKIVVPYTVEPWTYSRTITRNSIKISKRKKICYFEWLCELSTSLSIDYDLISFSEVINGEDSGKWLDAMKDKLKLMAQNGVWDLMELPEGCKRVRCKWVFKTKRDSHGNIEWHEARLVAKGFTKKNDIDYKETFSPISKKDSFRIIMALVAYYDLELHQTDVKTAFLNENLEEDIYMDQPVGFIEEGKEHMVCKLKKSIYGLK